MRAMGIQKKTRLPTKAAVDFIVDISVLLMGMFSITVPDELPSY
jgi:hypothetical protein